MITARVAASAEAVKEHYDSFHYFYRDTWGLHLHHGLWERRGESADAAIFNLSGEVAGLAEIGPGDRVCDIGCGYGGAAMYLAERQGAKVIGITLSKEQCDEAERLASMLPAVSPQPEFVCGDWLTNSFEEASFDAAVSIECFSHIADKAGFFCEAARVLKPGRKLGMAVWLAGEKAGPFSIRYLLEPICHEGRFPSLVTASELKSLAESEGFSVEAFSQVGRQVKKTWLVIAFRLAGKVFRRKEYRRFLRENLKSDRIFALTVLRVMIAYETGALEYGLVKLARH